MEGYKLFSIGPVYIKNKLNKNLRIYKYFKHLTTCDNVEIFTYNVKNINGKYKIKKIIINNKYKT